MERLWVVLLAIGLVAAFSIRAGTLDEPHTLAYDTEGMLKLSRQIIKLGHIPENDPLRYANYFENGWDNREILPLTPYTIAFLSFGQENLVKQAAMWYPVIFGLLSIVIVAYIGKELFGYPGLTAGLFLGVLPGFIFRTSAGFNDKEAIGMFLMVLGTYFYVSAFKKKNFYLSTLSGISFGISALGWGGFHLLMIPISLFTLIEIVRGKARENLIYLPIMSAFLIIILDEGLGILRSYHSMLILGTAGYLLIDYYFGPKIAKTDFGRSINKTVREFVDGLGKQFKKIRIPESSISTALISLLIGILLLIAMGRDPIQTFISLGNYLRNPIRGGIHSRSVGEQTAVSSDQWDSELGIMKLLTYPILYIIDPTEPSLTTNIALTFIFLTSIPLISLILYFEPRWEYLFAGVWAFFSNFSANAAVRLFFPLMPAVAISGAAIISFIVTRKEQFIQKIGYIIPLAIFIALLTQSIQASKSLGTSMDPLWFQSLIWYKYNSGELSPIATWWDYGYWIFNIADRPSLADGSNSYYPADVDLGRLFTYDNEEQAIDYLKSKKTNFVTMDGSMIPKFYWISSIGFDDEAKAITYPQFYYKGQANTTIGMASIYTAGDGTQILVTEGGVIIGHPQQGFAAVEKIATNSGYVENPINATKSPGAVVIASNVAMYIRPEAENMLFTKLYLMNGAGLEHFEQVFNNGYLKTYYVDYA